MLLKRFLPAPFRAWLAHFRPKKPPFEGVYKNFAESNPTLAHFDKDWWKEHCKAGLEGTRQELSSPIPWSAPSHALLSLLIATFPDGPIRILDFGGGIGFDALIAARLTGRGQDLDYHVVDMPVTCEAGREIPDLPVTFHEDLLPASERFDIVYASSSLQYVEDYKATLERFAEYQPRYIFITRTSVHTGAQFVRAQTNVGGRIPLWVFDLGNLDAALPDYIRSFCVKNEVKYQVDNFPPAQRVEWMTNVLYKRRAN